MCLRSGEGTVMKITRTHAVAVFALAMFASPVAFAAGQFRVVPDETGTICQSGTKSDAMTIEGPDEVKVTDEKQGAVNATICVSPDSVSAVHLNWHQEVSGESTGDSGGLSSGTVGHGCAEILGVSNIRVRAVNTNFHESATYYTCIQAPAQQ
jgi:hypothetical protein